MIRSLIKFIQTQIVERPFVEILLTLVLSLISAYLIIMQFRREADEDPELFYGFIVIGLIIILITMNIYLEMDRTRQKKANAFKSRMIRKAVYLQDPLYDIPRWHNRYEMNKNGDVNYKRITHIRYDGVPIIWHQVELRMIEGEPYRNVKDLNIRVRNLLNGTPLDWIPIIEHPDKISMAIILNPVVDESNQDCQIEMTAYWKGLFKPLFSQSFSDEGGITVLRDTEKIELEFIAPDKFEFTGLQHQPTNIGIAEINLDPTNQRSRLTFTAENVSAGTQINYWLKCKKIIDH